MYRPRVDAKYVWFNQGTEIVLMYFLNNVPFTFEEVFSTRNRQRPELSPSDLETIRLADTQRTYEQEDVFKGSRYLIQEQTHPCFDDIEIENADILPDDICGK